MNLQIPFFAKLKTHLHSSPGRELPTLNSCFSPEVWTRWPNSLEKIQPWSGSFWPVWATISTQGFSRRLGWGCRRWEPLLRSSWGTWAFLRVPLGRSQNVSNTAAVKRNSSIRRSIQTMKDVKNERTKQFLLREGGGGIRKPQHSLPQ